MNAYAHLPMNVRCSNVQEVETKLRRYVQISGISPDPGFVMHYVSGGLFDDSLPVPAFED
jgi:hypothetical protein